MNQDFQIKTDKFQGPLELLLELVEKKKLHITDVSLGKVADEYLEYLRTLRSFPIENASQFIVIASTLILIKSKALLPYLDLTSEEEEDIQELELRLKTYRLIKEISGEVEEMYGKHIIFQLNPPKREPKFSPGKGLDIRSMLEAVNRTINELPKTSKKPEKQVRAVVSLEEMIRRLEKRIQSAVTLSFKDFSNHSKAGSQSPEEKKSKKIEVVVSFLALLELVKQGLMEARQERRFGDIEMQNQKLTTPRYGN